MSKKFQNQFPADLTPLGEPMRGSYNIVQFYQTRGSELEKLLPGVSTVVARTSIANVSVMDLQRWKSEYIDHYLLPSLMSIAPPFIVPRVYFSTPESKPLTTDDFGTEKTTWYRMEYGTSLSNLKRFPEGGDFPEHIFEQMISVFPTLAKWTEWIEKSDRVVQPKSFNQHLQEDFGIFTIQENENQVVYTVNQKEVTARERKMIELYSNVLAGIQLQNKTPVDAIAMDGEFNRLMPPFGEVRDRWVGMISPLVQQEVGRQLGLSIINRAGNIIDNILYDPYADYYELARIPHLLEKAEPRHGNTTDYAKNVLGTFLEKEIYQKYKKELDDDRHLFAQLAKTLGIPERPLDLFDQVADSLHSRPFMFTHGDLHRKNLMVSEKEDQLIIMDWDTLDMRDWVFDAVKHVKKIRYNENQEHTFWQELLYGKNKMPEKYIQDIEGIQKDIPIYEMFLTIEEIIVMLIRNIQAMATGEMTLDNPSTLRNMHKLVNALNTARADEIFKERDGIEGWECATETDFDSVFAEIENFVENTENDLIKAMRDQRDQKNNKDKPNMTRKTIPKAPPLDLDPVLRSADLERT